MREKIQILNQFALKLIAILTMTLDHVGIFMMLYAPEQEFANALFLTGYIFRCIGRISFPLFILMFVEGIFHTRNIKKYIMRVGIMAAILMIAQIIIYYAIDTTIEAAYSPLLDLLLCMITIALLNRKDELKYLAILPIAYILLTFGVQVFEVSQMSTVLWLPFYIRPGYSLLGLLISLAFFYSYKIAYVPFKRMNVTDKVAYETNEFHSLANTYMSLSLIVILTIIYLLSLITSTHDGYPLHPLDIYDANLESWGMLAILFIFMYNGKRGYNKPWFKYGCYLYFPVHIVIIFIIFTLIYM